MVTIESTAEFAAQTYEKMAERLEVIRRRLNRPLSLAEKVLLSHLDDPENQEIVPGETYIRVRPDRVILQDVLGQTAMLQFVQTMRDKVAVPTTVHCDHLIQAREEGVQDLRESLAENGEVYGFLRSASARYGCRILGARGWHHSPGQSRKLRLPWSGNYRHRLAHPERGWAWGLLGRA